MHSIETIPEMKLNAEEIGQLSKGLEEYHAIYSPLFRRREQREWSSLGVVQNRAILGNTRIKKWTNY